MRHLLISSLVLAAACAQGDANYATTTESVSGAWATPVPGSIWRIGFNVVNPSAPGSGPCFGKPLAQLVHAGEDWGNGAGTAVRAIGAGTVVYAAFANYPGSVIVIRHNLSASERSALGIAQSTIYSMYGHLTGLLVSVGATVSTGQQIASVLDQASNSHLHWEVRTVEAPALCGFNDPGPGYTDSGTDARNWGYLSPSGSVAALANAGPGTCDNNVPVGGTACNPADPGAQFVCTSPGLPSSQQWTRQMCTTGQTCVGTRCQGGSVPACGSGLFCAGNQIPGSSACLSGSSQIFCCPSGQTIVNGRCSGSAPPACGSGLFCAGNQIPGASACTSGSQTLFCCPSGQTIVNGACASAVPPACGSGLFCAANQISGSSACVSGSQTIFCCAPGHTIVNGACS